MRLLQASFFLVLLTALAGCRQDDAIRVEIVKHDEREPINLRVAIVPHGDIVWFFRLSGPESAVKAQVPAFEDFVKSVRFDDQKEPPITWTEPKDWKKDPQGVERYAGYRIDNKPKPLEVTVTRLPRKSYSLLNNVHRWQKQINLPLAEDEDELKPFVKREKIGDQEVTWVDMTGLGVHSVSKPPQPVVAGDKKFIPPLGLKQPRRGGVPFKYDVPAGWVKKEPRQFALEVYEVAEGNKVAEVTLTPAGGDPASNINRWRGQVGLPELPEDEIAKSASKLPMAGIPNIYVDLANPAGPAGKNRTLGVIIPHDRTTWFVKMMGPHDWVGQNKNAFETFVKSFKLDAP